MGGRGRRTIAVAAAALLAAALLAACGDDGSETTTVTETETVGASETTTTDQKGGEEGSPADGQTPPADREVSELTGFSSPSGNIGCFIDRSSVRCDIAKRDWEPPEAPADCDLDFGQGIELVAGGEAEFVCAGDTALGAGSALAYGESIAAGLLRCESSRAGMNCRDIETGRGFTIARERYEIF
jgi:hypothetical protein